MSHGADSRCSDDSYEKCSEVASGIMGSSSQAFADCGPDTVKTSRGLRVGNIGASDNYYVLSHRHGRPFPLYYRVIV